jgi:hypothetical protein
MNVSIVAVLVLAFPFAAFGKLLPETEKLAGCLRIADWTLQAGEALRAGISKERQFGLQMDEARATIEQVYRDRPHDLSDYIAAKLGLCLRERGAAVGDLSAKACYDLTLWAGTFFASKRRGVALERLMQGPLPQLAEAVYRSERPEAEFREHLLVDCLSR